jgi:glycosyltransferase involved in cell wall biosynthesis
MTWKHGQPENPEGAQSVSHDTREGQHPGSGLVSVVVPCYNQAHFLDEAVESVLAQSYSRFEIVVVDDGSTDNTSEIAEQYRGVRCIRQDNQGLSAARNSGLRYSEGEYVVFLDADDRLLPEALQAGIECLKSHPECAVAFGPYRLVASDGSFLKQRRQPVVDEDSYAALLKRNYIGVPAVMMYRRAVFESVGGFDSSVDASADADLYLRIARRFAVCSHETVVAEYRQHGVSMSSNSARMLRASLTVLRKQRRHVKGNKKYEEAYKAGIKNRRWRYGDRLVEEVRAHVREREWKRALKGVLVLLHYYPQGIALLNERRMERHLMRRRLPRRLQDRKQELEVHERRLKEVEGTKESGSALAKERQEVELLRRRVRRLERQTQSLNQRAYISRDGEIWRLFKKLGDLWIKVQRKRQKS